MKRSILKIMVLAISICSCRKNKTNCSCNYKDIFKEDTSFIVKKLNGDGSFNIFDNTKDSFPTGFYIFDSNGELKSYRFVTSFVSYIYSEEYSNKKWKSIGSPLVNQTLFLKKDSCYLTFNFFSLNKKYTQIFFINNLDSLKLQLSKSNIYSNMLSSTIRLKLLQGESTINGIITAEYINQCSQFTYSFVDTIRIDLLSLCHILSNSNKGVY
jgi:hypothetical protein